MFKYNIDGEWRPICFSGDVDSIRQRIRSESEDERVQGSLFYIRTTGFCGIEFVARGFALLPPDELQLPNGVRLLPLAEPNEDEGSWGGEPDLFMYDGWIPLENDEVGTVQAALDQINWTVGLLSHVYNCKFDWSLKYLGVDHRGGPAVIGASHTELLSKMVSRPLRESDKAHLQSALDWLAHAKRLQSPFNRYLACWIALEGVSQMLFEGKLFPEWSIDRRGGRISARKRLRNALMYLIGRIDSISPSISEAQKIKIALERVFGGQESVDAVFRNKTDGITLAGVRHKIAHGILREWDMGDLNRVRRALSELEDIVHEFVRRLVLGLRPEEDLPRLQRLMQATFRTDDPRTMMFCTDLRMLSAKSWRIQSNWLD